jgi:ATP-binding cassette, subfamily D (ALD), peroxisomal long-chain fatty acid import protein
VESVLVLATLVNMTGAMMRAFTPPFGKYVEREGALEGDFRSQHARLINFSEEIALYGGHKAEKDTVDKGYYTLLRHIHHTLKMKFFHGVLEDYTIKYIWGALGLLMCAVPVFITLPNQERMSVGDRSEAFVTNRRNLMAASDASNRILFSYRDIIELSGHTKRVSDLLDVMDAIRAGKFDKKLVSGADTKENEKVLKTRGTVIESEDIRFIDV